MRIGIVAVQGVIPQKRYGFQDEVAENLCKALNTSQGTDLWCTSVVHRESPAPAGSPVQAALYLDSATMTRVSYGGKDNRTDPHDVFEVIEAYWSPIDKHKTSSSRVLAWLGQTLFLPLNNTARYSASITKTIFDILYVVVSLAVLAALFVLSILTIAWGINAASALITAAAAKGHPTPVIPTFFSIGSAAQGLATAFHPGDLLAKFNGSVLVGLIAAAVGAFVLGEAARAALSFVTNFWTLVRDGARHVLSRLFAILILVAVGVKGVLIASEPIGPAWDARAVPTVGPAFLHPIAFIEASGLRAPLLALAVAVLLFQAGRLGLAWFTSNFFGDVQIYTTRDENSDFFPVRQAILACVTDRILDTIAYAPQDGPYDRVHVVAHSLGSTIALDALMRVRDMRDAGNVISDAWERIRSFVTFGTSLEKTKYFFNAWSPTLSQRGIAWQNDLYGRYFTADFGALRASNGAGTGIYWQNCWYNTDPVANPIASYRSFVSLGAPMRTAAANRRQAQMWAIKEKKPVAGRLVAENRKAPKSRFAPLHLLTHGDYLQDQKWFWLGCDATNGVLAVLTQRDELPQESPVALDAEKAPNPPEPFDFTPDSSVPDVYRP